LKRKRGGIGLEGKVWQVEADCLRALLKVIGEGKQGRSGKVGVAYER